PAPTPCTLPSFPTRRSSDLLVLPRRLALEHVELVDHVLQGLDRAAQQPLGGGQVAGLEEPGRLLGLVPGQLEPQLGGLVHGLEEDRKSTRLNSSHDQISYAV